MKTILVLGATGMLGAPAARHLRRAGYSVRALARDPDRARAVLPDGFDIVGGDATDGERVLRTAEGCDAIHVSVGGAADRPAAENAARAVAELGVPRIVYLSGATVCEENAWHPMIANKLAAEAAVMRCGGRWTIFRPSWCMGHLVSFVRSGRPMVIGHLKTPYHWYAPEDFGRMAATAMGLHGAEGKHLYVFGPEAMTVKDAAERYARLVDPGARDATVMPIWMAKLLGWITRNDMLRYAAHLMAYFEKVGEPGDPAEANELLGAPTTTLEEWTERQEVVSA